MNDMNRITLWLTNDESWLLAQKERIEAATNGAKKCSIEERTIIVSNKPVRQQALFYTNGYYANGEWVAAEDFKESPINSRQQALTGSKTHPKRSRASVSA